MSMNTSTSETALAASNNAPTIYKLIVLLILVGGIAYCNSFTKTFLMDDVVWITSNEKINDLGAYVEMMNTRPVVAVSLYLNHRVHGLTYFGYHLVNVAIHLAAAITLFGVVRRSLLLPRWNERFTTSAHWLAFAVALLWMVHPLQTQAVTYIIQRGESLMGLFFLLSLYCVIRGSQSTRGWLWNIASLACFVAGAKSKEVMVTFLPVVLCYDLIILGSIRDSIRKRWWYYLAIFSYWAFVLSGAFTALTADSATGSAGFGLRSVRPHVYMMTQAGILLHYIRLVFVPYPQSFWYRGWPWVTEFADFWPAGLAIGLLALATAWLMLRRHWIGFLGAWFFGILSVTSIVPLIDPGFEHRMYLPLAAFCVLVVISSYLMLSKWSNRRLAEITGVLLLAMAATTLTVLTFRRNEDYRSMRSMWESVIQIYPNDAAALTEYAAGLLGEGKNEEAKETYEKALRAKPNWFLAEAGYGQVLCRLDMQDEGMPYLLRELNRAEANVALAPAVVISNYELGKNYWMRGDRKAAETHLKKVTELAPQKQEGFGALACVLYEQGRKEEARQLYAKALQMNPRFAQNSSQSAEITLNRHKKLNAYYRKEALFHALQAAQATEFEDPAINAVLAEAYAANQMYAQASQIVQDSLTRMAASENPDRRAQLQRALVQYKRLQSEGDKKAKS